VSVNDGPAGLYLLDLSAGDQDMQIDALVGLARFCRDHGRSELRRCFVITLARVEHRTAAPN
jgi:hypothetical protein